MKAGKWEIKSAAALFMSAITEALMLSEITSCTMFHNACEILFACACGFVVKFSVSTLFDLIDEASQKVRKSFYQWRVKLENHLGNRKTTLKKVKR